MLRRTDNNPVEKLRYLDAGQLFLGPVFQGYLVDGLRAAADVPDFFAENARGLKSIRIDNPPFAFFRESRVLCAEYRKKKAIKYIAEEYILFYIMYFIDS